MKINEISQVCLGRYYTFRIQQYIKEEVRVNTCNQTVV